MDEGISVLIQCVLISLPAAWLTLGAIDNIIHPEINRDDVARVLRLDSLADWPEVLANVSYRRVDNPKVVRRLFCLIVVCEVFTAIALWAGAAGFALQILGIWASDAILPLAQAGVLAFTVIWASFLIVGQWFYYWYGEFGQQTHFLAMIWGLSTLGVLSA